MNSMDLIQMMASQIRYLKIDIKEVEVEHKPHPSSQQKQCFNNAFLALKAHPEDRFVLGYYIMASNNQQLPIEHAWIKEGAKYYDVTLDPREGDTYISLVELTWAEVYEYVSEKEHAPDLYAMNRFAGMKAGN